MERTKPQAIRSPKLAPLGKPVLAWLGGGDWAAATKEFDSLFGWRDMNGQEVYPYGFIDLPVVEKTDA